MNNMNEMSVINANILEPSILNSVIDIINNVDSENMHQILLEDRESIRDLIKLLIHHSYKPVTNKEYNCSKEKLDEINDLLIDIRESLYRIEKQL